MSLRKVDTKFLKQRRLDRSIFSTLGIVLGIEREVETHSAHLANRSWDDLTLAGLHAVFVDVIADAGGHFLGPDFDVNVVGVVAVEDAAGFIVDGVTGSEDFGVEGVGLDVGALGDDEEMLVDGVA